MKSKKEAKEKAKMTKALDEAFTINNEPTEHKKRSLVFLIIGIVAFVGGGACLAFALLSPGKVLEDLTFPTIPTPVAETTDKVYSSLTGEELADPSTKNAPVYCIQTPNGLDGARPQTNLTEAGVVFEAIAEGGITRFAAIYQNPQGGIIGPIRSLRIYFLDWDVPFDCTIVHAGGSIEAVNAVRSYKHISEDPTYMYRGNYNYHLWNNLFTTPELLGNNSADYNRMSSNPQGFTRTTKEAADKARYASQTTELDIVSGTDGNTSALTPQVSTITLSFASGNNFSPVYKYNVETNSYDRFYAYGGAHEVYHCPSGNYYGQDPQDNCPTTQLSPSVVIAMVVDERLSSDGVHEAITTVGSGTAYVFQNGQAIKGTWRKGSREEQLHFFDEAGNEISLIPGQTWISAIPGYGSVDY